MAEAVRRPRWRRLLAGVCLALFAAALLGPRSRALAPPSLSPDVPRSPAALAAWIEAREAAVPGLRAGTAARIVWADPARPARAPCAIVYLHGFTASHGEGAPTHAQLARRFGCNLYLPRLPGHGLDADDALRGIDAAQLHAAAAEALAVGGVLGERVVVVGSSMGGALALQAVAGRPAGVRALVLWSPLVRETGDRLRALGWPWGAHALSWSKNGGDPVMRWRSDHPYWASAAHLDGYRALYALTRGGMTADTYARITAPVFLGYYYRDPEHQDPTVSVAQMHSMFAQLGTPPALREAVAFPDAEAHVIASPLRSRAVPDVFAATCRFLHARAEMPLAAGRTGCEPEADNIVDTPAAHGR
ncbi:alpha/beta fold hydrolase [Luteimonas sp. FCS-9]|uniref:alpha/beta hydrolase n=1 Tax=Luteimonas sp. FCS-9 TaxID=1547516 RepID=UPI000AB198BE|nr:alpha/beta fold hydrolase [Luteimonas sp. FCS-9]